MNGHPYEVLRCSWPRPVRECARAWTSEPEWDAPLTHLLPVPVWRELAGEPCWTIDWRELFRGETRFGGEMRRFHVVFQIRMKQTGKLRIREDDGSVIRRDGVVLHADRAAHGPGGEDLPVAAGDVLEIAQWQLDGDWLWGARYLDEPAAAVTDFLDGVHARLRHPEGPPLKIYSAGRHPLRTAAGVYSMILNGYAPAAVHVYGDYQWLPDARRIMEDALPFAHFTPLADVLAQVRSAGGEALSQMAQRHWFVMKSCVALLCAPHEFCLMDDDVLVLGPVDDALRAFASADFVFTPDCVHEAHYRAIWGEHFPRPGLARTSMLNTGLYWLRNRLDRGRIARTMLAGHGRLSADWAWEQGLFAYLFDDCGVCLPSQRYLYPLLDGLPGGIGGYPYAGNPCEFASVHFGGPVEKPDDAIIGQIAPQILGRRLHEPGDHRRLF